MWDLMEINTILCRPVLWKILTLLLVLIVIIYHWKRRKFYIISAKLPGPFAYPIIGNIHLIIGKPVIEIIKTIDKTVEDLHKEKLPIRLWVGPFLLVCVFRPEDYQIVLNDPESCEKSIKLYNAIRILLGNCLPMKPVSEWKPLRKAYSPAFAKSMIEFNMPILNERCQKLMDILERKNTLWEYSEMDMETLAVATDCIVGCQTRTSTMNYNDYFTFGKNIRRCNNICFDRTLKFWLMNDFIFKLTNDYKEAKKIIDYCAVHKNKIIETRKQIRFQMKQVGMVEETKCFLDILLDLLDEGKVTEKDIFDDISFMFSSGDTTGACVYNVLVLLAIHQDVQSRLQDELYSIFGGSNRPIDAADLREMVYLEMIIKETLRVLTEVASIGRTVAKDLKLTECTLPKGTLVVVSPLLIHKNPEIWPEPQKFDPDRFLPDNCARRHPYSFLAFSNGPRNCIGSKLAFAVVKTAVATIIREYSLQTDATMENIVPISTFIGRYKCDRPISLEKRRLKV